MKINRLRNKSNRKPSKASKHPRPFQQGKWSDVENLAYLQFLVKNWQIFQMKGMRKRNHIFMKMARYLTNRSPPQCRSHHQKVEKYAKSRSVQEIAQYLIQKLKIREDELEAIIGNQFKIKLQQKKITKQNMSQMQLKDEENLKNGQETEEKQYYKIQTNRNNEILVSIVLNNLQTWN